MALYTSKMLYESVGKNTVCVGEGLLSFSSMYKWLWCWLPCPTKLLQSTMENTSKNKHESRRLHMKSSGHAHPVGSLPCSTPNNWILLNSVGGKWLHLSSMIITEALHSSSSSFVLSCSWKLIQTQTGREWICWEVTYF